MPPQLRVLLPLFALFVILYLGVRAVLLPVSFGKHGHYRANAIDEVAAQKTRYAGKAACAECHTDEGDKLDSDLHSDLSCEVCHGPGDKHIASTSTKGTLNRSGDRESCGICHQKNPARNTEYVKQVNNREHHLERKLCIDCHNPHAVWDMKN